VETNHRTTARTLVLQRFESGGAIILTAVMALIIAVALVRLTTSVILGLVFDLLAASTSKSFK